MLNGAFGCRDDGGGDGGGLEGGKLSSYWIGLLAEESI